MIVEGTLGRIQGFLPSGALYLVLTIWTTQLVQDRATLELRSRRNHHDILDLLYGIITFLCFFVSVFFLATNSFEIAYMSLFRSHRCRSLRPAPRFVLSWLAWAGLEWECTEHVAVIHLDQ